MKTSRILSGLVIVSAVLFSACQKQIDSRGEDPTLPPVVEQDSNYLYRVWETDTTTSTLDSIDVSTYFYDAQKRVTKRTEFYGDAVSTPDSLDVVTLYSYNGNDTVPFKSIIYDYANGDTTTTFHYLDAQGRKLKDSSISFVTSAFPFKRVSNYTWHANGFVIDFSATVTGGGSVLLPKFKDSATLDSRGNIIYYAEYYYLITGTPELHERVNITYDNNPNPEAKLSIFKIRDLVIGGEPDIIEFFPQFNNGVKFDYFIAGNGFPDDIYTFFHQYNYLPNFYPASGKIYDVNPGSFGSKLKYEYKKL